MNRIQVIVFVVLALQALSPTPASAAAVGMEVEPGLWEFTSNRKTPGGIKQETEQQCIKENRMDPESFLDDSPGCTLSDVVVDAARMAWKMSCQMGMGKTTGSAEFSSKRTTIEGSMTMNMEFGGHKASFESTWKGKRIGDCK